MLVSHQINALFYFPLAGISLFAFWQILYVRLLSFLCTCWEWRNKGKLAFISIINTWTKHKMWKLEMRMQSRGGLEPSWSFLVWSRVTYQPSPFELCARNVGRSEAAEQEGCSHWPLGGSGEEEGELLPSCRSHFPESRVSCALWTSSARARWKRGWGVGSKETARCSSSLSEA